MTADLYDASWQVSRRAVADPEFMALLRQKMDEIDARYPVEGGSVAAGMKVAKVEPGSVILLTGVDMGDPELMPDLLEAFAEAVGHSRFVLIRGDTDGAEVEVWGPDVDLKAKVEQLLADARQ